MVQASRWRETVMSRARIRQAAVLVAAVTGVGCTTGGALRQAEQAQTNTQVAVVFVTTAFDQHQVQRAFDRCVGTTYKEHDPAIADGRDAALSALTNLVTNVYPRGRFYVKRTAAQGDLVFIHAFWDQKPGETQGEAVMAVFRFDRGKIVEHWDVVRPVPDTSANSNTMF
jgi:predicted SnoaL-like aldol condensation-catalyzing enzyme